MPFKRYDFEQLRTPETYAEDPDLATLARQIARSHFESVAAGHMGRGEFREAVLAGQYPDLILGALQVEWEKQDRQSAAQDKGRAIIQSLQLPEGYSVYIEEKLIILSGPFSEDLHARLKRAGGWWDGMSGTNRKVWMIPLTKGVSLKRIFANFAQSAQAEAEARAEEERRRAEERAARERQWAEERAAREKRWAEERAARRLAPREPAPESPCQSRRLYPVSARPALNVPMRLGTTAVVFTGYGQPFRISEDHPSIHGSHLLGHEGSRGCYAYYRPASEDEIQALESREIEQQAQARIEQDRRQRRAALEKRIIEQGECPEGDHVPAGDVLADTSTIYGGGDWFVVGADWIWYCRNNGADGDDWSRNNVRTGGAGAIGWRVPYSAELAAEIERLVAS